MGRWETNFATGLVFQGIAADITFSNNRFTTWPMTNFYLPDPANTAEAVFRAVWVVPSNTYVNSRWSERSRPPAQNVTLAQGRLSTTAFDFTGTNLWPDYNNLTSLLTNSAPLYTTNTTAISALPNGFAPQGRIERALPRYDTNLHLAGVTEVAVGQTTLTAGTNLAVTVRAAEHRTVASGAPGTVPLGTNLWLTANFNLNNGATSSLAQPVALTTSTNNGTATTTLALPGTNCLVRLRTWLGPATNSTFASNQVAWAAFDYAVGTVVSLTASPDVGDDKNTALAKRAKLHFTRTGSPAALSNTLTVNFVLPTNGVPELTTPLDRRNLIASYGSTGSGDYYFATPTGGTLGTVIPGSTNTVTFNANSNEVVVSIITRADNLTEGNVVRVDLRGGAGYALGAKTRSDVYIYDGPEWTLVEMYPWYYGTAVTGLNSGVVDAAGQYTVNPLIVGTADFDDGSGMATHGGLYPWPSTYLTDFGRTFRPQAVSDRDSINDNILLVGFDGSAAKAFYNTPTNVTTLPRFAGVTSGTAAAYGVTVNVSGETHIVGFSSSINGVKRPALWLNFGVPTDLASLLPTNYAGVARASTWGDDIVVGDVDYAVTNAAGDAFLPRRGFRTLGTGWTIRKTGDDLPPPNSNGIPFESPTTANAVNLEGVAVGGYKYVVGQSTNIIATYWTSRSSGSNAAGTFLGVWVAPQGFSSFDTASEVIAINSAGRMVGYSGDGSTFKRAVLKKHATAPWLDLNDRHFVSGLTDWSLQRAVGINEQGIIIGNGTKSGSTRAFVLVPRTSGN